MGAFSRQDEQAMLFGCGTLLLGIGIVLAALGFAAFKLVEWVFS